MNNEICWENTQEITVQICSLGFRTAQILESQSATNAFAHLYHSGTHTSSTRVFPPIPPES